MNQATTPSTTVARLDPSSVTIARLANFYDFRSSKDVTRYKTRLLDGLRSTGSTRLPTATVQTRPTPRGPTA